MLEPRALNLNDPSSFCVANNFTFRCSLMHESEFSDYCLVVMPKAYVISEVAIIDEALAAKYRELAAASIAEYGGRYLVRGAEANIVEGALTSRLIVVVEFPSMESARAWYASPSYA